MDQGENYEAWIGRLVLVLGLKWDMDANVNAFDSRKTEYKCEADG